MNLRVPENSNIVSRVTIDGFGLIIRFIGHI
jgi:hypothetical protein